MSDQLENRDNNAYSNKRTITWGRLAAVPLLAFGLLFATLVMLQAGPTESFIYQIFTSVVVVSVSSSAAVHFSAYLNISRPTKAILTLSGTLFMASLLVNPITMFSSPVFPNEYLLYYVWFSVLSLFSSLGLVVGGGVVKGMGATSPPDRKELLTPEESLRDRARAYRGESRVSLGIILLSLIGGAVIFIGADTIASRDIDSRLVAAARATNLLDERQKSLSGQIEVLRNEIGRLEASEVSSEALYTKLLKIEESLSERVDDLSLRLRYSGLPVGLPLEQLIGEAVERRNEDTALQSILSSLSTRVGAVFLIIFLVQILSGLYRYSARMAAHHESRADMLSLIKDLEDKDLMRLLSSEYVDFGKAPSSPIEELTDVLERVLREKAK